MSDESARLDAIESELKEIRRLIEPVADHVARAELAANQAANSAQKSLSAFESLNQRFDLLRREHVTNHPHTDSLVPAALVKGSNTR